MMNTFRNRWMLLNSTGFMLGFVSFGLVSAVAVLFRPDALGQPDGFQFYQSIDPNALPEGLDRNTYEIMYRYMLIQHLVMYPLFGAVLGSLQAFPLRRAIPGIWQWICVTALGFLTIIGLELVKRHLAIGPFAGPVEPIMIVLGGGGLAGLFQWIYLRTANYSSGKWLGLWIGGLVLGIVAAIGVLMGIGTLFGDAIHYLETNTPKLSLGIELSIFGAVVGAVAGLVSGSALRACLGIRSRREKQSVL